MCHGGDTVAVVVSSRRNMSNYNLLSEIDLFNMTRPAILRETHGPGRLTKIAGILPGKGDISARPLR